MFVPKGGKCSESVLKGLSESLGGFSEVKLNVSGLESQDLASFNSYLLPTTSSNPESP
jgi:hypothetical protein